MLREVLAGRYRIESEIGSGGTATVWRAVDIRSRTEVAVKLLKQSPAGDDEVARARLEREGSIPLLLGEHECLATVVEHIAEPPALVFELLQGETLHDVLGRGRQTLAEVLQWALPIASLLKRAHGSGVIHRDITPRNIHLDRDGRPRLIDWGAALLDDGHRLSNPGTTFGTPGYMAPEHHMLGESGANADCYSFATVVLDALRGRELERGRHEPPSLPPEISELIEAMRAAEPSERATMADFVEVARAFAREPDASEGSPGDRSPVAPRSAGSRAHARRSFFGHVVSAGAAAALVAALGPRTRAAMPPNWPVAIDLLQTVESNPLIALGTTLETALGISRSKALEVYAMGNEVERVSAKMRSDGLELPAMLESLARRDAAAPEDDYFYLYDASSGGLLYHRYLMAGGERIGLNYLVNGERPIATLLECGRRGRGLFVFQWHQPSSGAISRKVGYVVNLGGRIVGSGTYI
jgi:serine/threonine protein kinase